VEKTNRNGHQIEPFLNEKAAMSKWSFETRGDHSDVAVNYYIYYFLVKRRTVTDQTLNNLTSFRIQLASNDPET